MKKPVLYQKWIHCPTCGKRLCIADSTAKAQGIYLKCKECKKIIEIKI